MLHYVVRNTFFMQSPIRKLALICILLIIVGAMVLVRSQSVTPQSAPICADCNVIIVGLDALGASHVSHLGYGTVTTPTLDGMAKSGTSFSSAISPSSWTVPSFMSVFTGMYPTEHKVVNKFSTFTKDKQVISNLHALSPQVVTLAEVFAQNGYTTGGFTGDAGVGAAFGYNQGFATYTDETTFGSIGNASAHALPWITEHKDEKLFIFLHGYDNHGQYALPDGYQGRFMPKDYTGPYKGTKAEQGKLREQGLAEGHLTLTPADVSFWRGWYDSKIHDTDARFAEFWKEYNTLGITRKTVVVLLADHGTEFYEHGRFDHGFTLYDELVHVPLVFVVPGLPAQPTISAEVTTLDVAPTLLDITGVTHDVQFLAQQRGKSLLPFLEHGVGIEEDVYIETDYRDFTHKRGIRTADGWKYVLTMETGDEELYQLTTDPHEQTNVASKYPSTATELKIRVIAHLRAMGTNPEGPWKTGCVPVYGDQCK